MVTVVGITGTTGPVQYELTPTGKAAIEALGYQLKTGLQPETDAG